MGLYFVAGGTSGIGRECVLELLRRDQSVVAIGLNPPHAEELKQLVPPAAQHALQIVTADLADPATAERIANEQPSEPVAGLVNAVGVVSSGGIETESFARWRKTISTNLDAAFLLTKALVPRLRLAKNAAIVNVSSICSARPCDSLAYSVSKAGLDMFTRHLARDLSRYGIRVNSVNPGVVRTNLHLSSGILDSTEYEAWLHEVAKQDPLGPGSVEVVRAAIMFLLGGDSAWTTGAILQVDGGRALT